MTINDVTKNVLLDVNGCGFLKNGKDHFNVKMQQRQGFDGKQYGKKHLLHTFLSGKETCHELLIVDDV